MRVGQYYLLPEYVVAKLGRPPSVFRVFTTLYNFRVRFTRLLAENSESTSLLLQFEAEAKLANRSHSCLSQALSLLSARSVYHLSQAPTEVYQPKFDALFPGPLCHDFNQLTKAKKAFATNNVALQVFTLLTGHRSWVGPHRFSGL